MFSMRPPVDESLPGPPFFRYFSASWHIVYVPTESMSITAEDYLQCKYTLRVAGICLHGMESVKCETEETSPVRNPLGDKSSGDARKLPAAPFTRISSLPKC